MVIYQLQKYIRQMWQSKKYIHHNQNAKNSSNQQKIIKFPSKAISLMMNSDSEQQQQHQTMYNNSIQSLSNNNLNKNKYNCPPPPLIQASKKEVLKQNNLNQANKMIKQIRYSCYRVQGQKLIQSGPGHYNSINLEQASMIRDNNEVLQNQIQKIRQQKKQLNRTIISLQNQNKAFKRQLNLLKQEMEMKDNIYQQLEQNLIKKTRQVQKLGKKLFVLENQVNQLRNQSKQTYNSKKRQGQLSKYLQNMNKKPNQNDPKKDKELTQKIFSQVSEYIIKRVQQLKNRLMEHKMSQNVQNIIEQFMAEMVNINPLTVSRANNKIRPQHTSTRNYQKLINDQQSYVSLKNGLFKQSQASFSVTPPKHQHKQKAQQLRNLQKSLQKLRQMEKQYISNTPNPPKDINFSSLDRSSLIGLDKSNRSKSRRKKIFQ